MTRSLIKPARRPALPDEAVEVLDDRNKPVAVMPTRQVLRQGLRHRGVFVCLRNLAGDIFLHKRPASEGRGEFWTLAASCLVLAGESRHAAAERCLEAEQGIACLELVETASVPPSPATRHAAITLFLTARTAAIPHAAEGVFVDREEFDVVLRDFSHMVTPFLLQAAPHIRPPVRQKGGLPD